MKRGGLTLALLALAALGVWLGPRPVHEPWTIEAMSPGRARELELEEALARTETWTRERLAERLRVAVEAVPDELLGAVPLDADSDGDEDVFAWMPRPRAGGSRLVFLLNDGGVRDVAKHLGAAFREPLAVQAAAAADLDRDGRLDIAVRLEDGSLAVLWNHLASRNRRAGDQ